MAISKELWVAYTRIFFVELAYWIVSIGMVFVNQFILTSDVFSEDLTIFITVFQILFSLGILVTLGYITRRYLDPPTNINLIARLKDPDFVMIGSNDDKIDDTSQDCDNTLDTARDNHNRLKDSSDGLLQLFKVDIPRRVNLETSKLVLPLSILYIGMLLFNNFCLKYVGVAFYFVSRSLTTVFNVTFTYFLIDERVSRGALICCAFIVLGFILGIDQESVFGSLSVIGVIFGVTSSLFTSLFTIYTKKTLAKIDKNIWLLILYNNINAIILCTPLLIIHGDIQALIIDKVVSPTFWFLLSISGVMAFFISIVTNASIKFTSPLTHNISGTAKACFQTVIAVIYYHEHKSLLWWISNFTILVASAAYSRIKQQEMQHKSIASPQSLVKNYPGSHRKFVSRRDSNCSSDSTDSENQISNSCSVKLQSTAT